jgi:uncharacterized protein DUF4333
VRGVSRSVRAGARPALIPLVALALAGAACGSATLDTDSVEQQILTQLRATDGPVIASVDCPSPVDVAAHGTFACTATQPDGTTWTIDVVQLDAAGTLDFRIEPEAA